MRPRTVSLIIVGVFIAGLAALGVFLTLQGFAGDCCSGSGILARPLLVLVGAACLIAALALTLRAFATRDED